MKKSKQFDLLALIFIPIAVALFSIMFKTGFLLSTVLFFGIPSIYLSLKNKKAIKKSFLFSALFSIPFTLILDYLISVDDGWQIITTLFPIKLFGIVALEQFIWAFLWVFYIIMFYEYFLDKKEKKSILSLFKRNKSVITPKMKVFSKFIYLVLLIFSFLAIFYPSILVISYSYVILGTILGVIPLTMFLLYFPNFLDRFLKMTVYFLLVAILVEYVGLQLNHWDFPGDNFLGKLLFFGHLIPFEEVFIYFILSTGGVLSYYEFFEDDLR